MVVRVASYLLGFVLLTAGYGANLSHPRRSAPASLRPVPAANFTSTQTSASVELSPEQLSREVMYGLLFREIARFSAKAVELAAQSKPNSFLRNHHRYYLELSEPLDSQLKAVAQDCVEQLDVVDRRAIAIINATKERYRGVPPGKAALVAPPPRELYSLQEERKRIILTAADQLAAGFGPAQFAVFESLVRRYVGSHYRPATAGR